MGPAVPKNFHLPLTHLSLAKSMYWPLHSVWKLSQQSAIFSKVSKGLERTDKIKNMKHFMSSHFPTENPLLRSFILKGELPNE